MERKKNKGITLIALIITIVVLLILAVVAINAITGDGIIAHARNAQKNYMDATKREEDLLKYYEGVLNTQEIMPTVAELQEKYEFSYYTTLSKAIEDVNGETTANADSTKENAVAGIYKDENNNVVVVLLKNTEEASKLTINKNVELNLGGNTITLTTNEAELYFGTSTTATINGMLQGSKIQKDVSGDASVAPKLINANGANISVQGGEYLCKVNNTTSGCLPIKINITNDANIKYCKIYSENSKNATGIQLQANSANIENSVIEVNSSVNGMAQGIKPVKAKMPNTQIKNSVIKGTSNERKLYCNISL